MARSRSAAEKASLFEGYAPLPGAFDEFVDAGGRPHAAVAGVVRRLDELGRSEFRRRKKLADTTFLRGGVTFSIYSGDSATERIFPFDLIPRVIAAHDWEPVRSGLEQRIRALNAFLTDVYGEQRILDEDIVPRALVESSKGYCKPVHGIRPPGGVFIHIAGIDLIRDAAGSFLVLEDNVRTPSGVSYVLENRDMMKKVFPSVFRECAVAPVEMYPSKLRDAMAAVAPRGGSEAQRVLLTPGPYNSAYFEHSFLARRIGCELVQGSDLFVDGDRVFAKTTHGSRPVEVVYRRVDDAFLDPQVFRGDSLVGVPGLVRAYARGNVALVNAIGNGIADDKAIYPYVPDMIRFYLSEAPILPQVPTYLCSREADCAYVLEHLDELVVKAVNEAGGYGMLMGPHGVARRAGALPRAHPPGPAQLHRAAAHRAVGLSDLDARRRAAAARRPAPLRRDRRAELGAARRPDARRAGEGLLRRELEPGRRVEGHLGRRGRRVICRVAESCFWLCRYVERVDTLARLLAVNNSFQLDVHLPQAEVWRPIVIVAGEEEHFLAHDGAEAIGDGEAVQEYLTWDREHASSISASLRWARENARTIREAMSVEMWEAINDTWLWLSSRSARRLYQRERDAFYDHLSKQCMLFHGVCYSTMLHEEPFVFMKLGRAVERVGWTGRILDVNNHSLGDGAQEENPARAAQWLAILRSCRAVDTFFQRGENALTGPAVAEFLLFDRTFPRAVLHNLDRARGLMAQLVAKDPPELQRPSWQCLERLRGSLLQMDGSLVQQLGLHRVLTQVVDDTATLCMWIHADYLDPPVETLVRGERGMRVVGPESATRQTA